MYVSPAGTRGVYTAIQPACLAVPLNNFVTDETWLYDGIGNWVEVGFIDDNLNILGPIQGLPNNYQMAFWYDHRPVDGGGPGNGHVLEYSPAWVNSTAYIAYSAANTYQIIFGPSNNYSGLSTDNSMSPTTGIYGSETTSNVTTSMAFFSNMSVNTYGTWTNPALPIMALAEAPQTQAWYSLYAAMNAGAPC
jgi:hypothetical protein